MKTLLALLLLIPSLSFGSKEEPPYYGTAWEFPDIISSDDFSTFQELIYKGEDEREMYDRRKGGRWVTNKAFLFDALFENQVIEIQVNNEFKNSNQASTEASKYAEIIGRLPNFLLTNVQTVWIHKGDNDYGGGNNNLLIHTGRTQEYLEHEVLEEILIHEAAHTSLDWNFNGSINRSEWEEAQKKDKNFISIYAKDYPDREDVAETILPWIAVKYRKDSISQEDIDIILTTIPNRLKLFDEQNFDIYPIRKNSK
tara:strand:+ start:208 stop:972 length:765 start_codon:yes stop_codon:yes gene_type:complete